MKFTAKATSIDNVTTCEGYYAELKHVGKTVPVIISKDGNSRKIIPSTLQYYTGIMTEKAQPIYSGDVVEVWCDLVSRTGIVKWSKCDAGWVIEDEFGEYHDLVGDTRCFA